jgi:hypothetical protein
VLTGKKNKHAEGKRVFVLSKGTCASVKSVRVGVAQRYRHLRCHVHDVALPGGQCCCRLATMLLSPGNNVAVTGNICRCRWQHLSLSLATFVVGAVDNERVYKCACARAVGVRACVEWTGVLSLSVRGIGAWENGVFCAV